MTDIKNLILSLLLLVFTVSLCSGQNEKKTSDNDKQSSRRLLKQANEALKNGDLFTAVDLYKLYDEIIPGKAEIQHDLGQLLLREKNYTEAKKYLDNAYKSNPDKYIIDLYSIALCNQILGEFEEAKSNYELFIKKARRNSEVRNYTRLAQSQINMIDSIDNIKNNTLDVVINLLDTSINKPHIEFSPIPYYGDKLIFGSLTEKEITYYDINRDKLPVRKLYMARRNGNSWKNLGEFDTIINGNDINTGNGAFSSDKKRFYFSRCEMDPDLNRIICKIFVSNLENNEWQQPIELPPVVNQKFTSNSMPTIGISRLNSDVLYFVSDRPEGYGGTDIWFTYYDTRRKEWREPKNCGRKINTVFNEITPYYNIDTKTLYFSSDGHPSIGGYDIFRSFGDGKNFNEVVNIGFPINSTFDDQYYILEDSRERGFFTSNRTGGYSLRHENCCDDIYEFIHRDFINIAVTGKVFGITDSSFFKTIESEYKNEIVININPDNSNSNEITLINDHPVSLYVIDKETRDELFVKTTHTSSGIFLFNLEQGMDYFISLRDFNNNEKRLPFTTKEIIQSDTINLETVLINTIPSQSIIVQNIYYEFAKSVLTDTAKQTIDKTIYNIMKTFPDIIVEISSHTDSIGSDKLNDKLSQERAQSVVDYLISKGIKEERLTAKGYGRYYPIAPNTNPDGSDNLEGRQKNRRTEFRIIGHMENIHNIIYDE